VAVLWRCGVGGVWCPGRVNDNHTIKRGRSQTHLNPPPLGNKRIPKASHRPLQLLLPPRQLPLHLQQRVHLPRRLPVERLQPRQQPPLQRAHGQPVEALLHLRRGAAARAGGGAAGAAGGGVCARGPAGCCCCVGGPPLAAAAGRQVGGD